MILFKDGIDYLLGKLGAGAVTGDARKIFGAYFNSGYGFVADGYDWQILRKSANLLLIPNYSSGTATITTGLFVADLSVTGTDLTDFKGRYFRKKGSANWYLIVNVNTATGRLTLDQPVVENSGVVEYEVWKRFYYPVSEARTVIGIDDANGNSDINSENYRRYEGSRRYQLSEKKKVLPIGVDGFVSDYSDGKLTLTADSDVATTTSLTADFLSYVTPGDLLSTANDYRVKRVEAANRLILWNKSNKETGAVDYVIKRDPSIGFQFTYFVTEKQVVPYTYQARVFDLVNEKYDRTILPKEFDKVILAYAVAEAKEAGNKSDWQAYVLKAQAMLKGLAKKHRALKSGNMQFAPQIGFGNGRGARR